MLNCQRVSLLLLLGYNSSIPSIRILLDVVYPCIPDHKPTTWVWFTPPIYRGIPCRDCASVGCLSPMLSRLERSFWPMAASLSGRLFAAGAHSRAWGPVHRLQNVKKKRDRASIRFISTSLRSVCEKPLLQYNGWKLGIQRCILSWYKSSMPDPPIEQMVGNRATDQHLPSLKWFNQLTIWSVTDFIIDPGQELVKSLFLWG